MKKRNKSEIYLEASLDSVSSYIRGEVNLKEAVKDLNNSDTIKKVRLKFSKTLIEITSSVFKQNPDLAIVQARRMWEISKPIETISFMCGIEIPTLKMLAVGLEWKRVKREWWEMRWFWALSNDRRNESMSRRLEFSKLKSSTRRK